MLSSFSLYFLLVFLAWMVGINYLSLILHRVVAHRAYALPSWWVTFWILFCNLFVIYINPRTWTADHRMHHAFSDTERDPDKRPGDGFWRWLGYILTHRPSAEEPQIQKFTRDPIFQTWWMRFLSSRGGSVLCEISALVLPLVVAAFLTSTWLWGLAFWVSVRLLGIGALCVQSYLGHGYQHKWGYRNYELRDDSVNYTFLPALFLSGGESLQNNHHAKPSRASHAHRKGEIDIGFLAIRFLAFLRIASLPPRPALALEGEALEGAALPEPEPEAPHVLPPEMTDPSAPPASSVSSDPPAPPSDPS